MMYILENNKEVNRDWIAEAACQSAEYLCDVFILEGTDPRLLMYMLAKYCSEHNELAACLSIWRFCRKAGYELPPHYKEIASDNDAFDVYCKYLMQHLTKLIV